MPFHVFASEFGEAQVPNFTSNPGFNALPGDLPAGSRLGFNALAGLRVFNGAAYEPAGGERLRIKFSSLETIVIDEPIEGFDLAVQPSGAYHVHYSFFLLGDGVNDPEPGAYLLELELYSTDPDVDVSDPFWIVFDYEIDQSEHDAAIEWVEQHMLGEPCPADLDGSGIVDVTDLLALLGQWGDCPPPCAADLNDDGSVDVTDLLALLGTWGACP